MLLNNHAGILLFYLLPYHWVWNLLNNKEKISLLNASKIFNNRIFAKPENYDIIHKRPDSYKEAKNGKIIQYVLEKYRPTSVLEIGPGSGFYLRQFLDFPSVKEYTAVDIVKEFTDYIKRFVLLNGEEKKVDLICGDFLETKFNKKFDLVVFMSALHHITDRTSFVEMCASLLSDNGRMVFIEPHHGLPRIFRLLKKYIKHHHKRQYWQDAKNIPTHHYLSLAEIKYLSRKAKLRISELSFFSIVRGDRHLSSIFKPRLGFFSCSSFNPLSLCAQDLYVLLEKR